MSKVKYNYKYTTCEVLILKDKASGETEEMVITLPHNVKNVNDRTKSRLLKEINDGDYLSDGEEAIYIKSAVKGIKVIAAELDDFLKIAVELSGKESDDSENKETEVE